MAASKSPDIPAEIAVACGAIPRILGCLAHRAKARDGSTPSGATAITPRKRRPGVSSTCSASGEHGVRIDTTAPRLPGQVELEEDPELSLAGRAP